MPEATKTRNAVEAQVFRDVADLRAAVHRELDEYLDALNDDPELRESVVLEMKAAAHRTADDFFHQALARRGNEMTDLRDELQKAGLIGSGKD